MACLVRTDHDITSNSKILSSSAAPGSGRDQVGNQVRHVGRPQAGDRIPTRRGRIARDRCSLVVAHSDIVEIGGVLRGIARDRVERRVDVA